MFSYRIGADVLINGVDAFEVGNGALFGCVTLGESDFSSTPCTEEIVFSTSLDVD